MPLPVGPPWTRLSPLIHGGGQERGIRSGTLDSAAIRAFAVAAEHAVATRPSEVLRLTALRDQLIDAVLMQVPDAVLRGAPVGVGRGNGSGSAAVAADGGPGSAGSDVESLNRLPGNAHFTFPGCEGDSLLYLLDARGVECSTGSACQAGVPQPSHVLLAMGVAEPVARGALRFSLGHTSTEADVQALVEAIGPVVDRARGAGLTGAEPAKASVARRAATAPGTATAPGSGLMADASARTTRASDSGASASTILKEEVTP